MFQIHLYQLSNHIMYIHQKIFHIIEPRIKNLHFSRHIPKIPWKIRLFSHLHNIYQLCTNFCIKLGLHRVLRKPISLEKLLPNTILKSKPLFPTILVGIFLDFPWFMAFHRTKHKNRRSHDISDAAPSQQQNQSIGG